MDVGKARFLFIKEALTWKAAERSCKLRYKGQLASLLTPAEITAVTDYCVNNVATDDVPGCWIGLNDLLKEGQYRWADGRKLGGFTGWYDGSLPAAPDTPGSTPQPDDIDQADNEDCVFIFKDFPGWHDRLCTVPYYYVCKVWKIFG